jgi:hypothetical protein
MAKRWWPLMLGAGLVSALLLLLLTATNEPSWRGLPERRSFQHNLQIVAQPAAGAGSGSVFLQDSALFGPTGAPTTLSWGMTGYGPDTRLWAALFNSLRGEQPSVLVSVSNAQRAAEPAGNGEAGATETREKTVELRMWVDGQLVPTHAWYGGSIGGRLWSQMVQVSIPDLVRLTHAERITGSAFGQQFMLIPEQMEALRDAASQLRVLYEDP